MYSFDNKKKIAAVKGEGYSKNENITVYYDKDKDGVPFPHTHFLIENGSATTYIEVRRTDRKDSTIQVDVEHDPGGNKRRQSVSFSFPESVADLFIKAISTIKPFS